MACNLLHSKQTIEDGLHGVVSYEYANEAARLAATGFDANDLYKVARQLDDGNLYVLIDDDPITWEGISNTAVLNKTEVRIKKASAGTLAKGQVVYADSWDTGDDVALCELAKADSASTLPAVGVVSVAATDTVEGKALLLGILHDVDTTGLTEGAPFYVSATTAGALTTTAPSGPYVVQALGVVLKTDATLGHLGVNIQGYRAYNYVNNPADLGTASPGTSNLASPSDHVHTMPKLDDVAAPDDNTDLNATISAHGLLPKLGGGTTNFLRADGTWAAPADANTGAILTWGDASIATSTTTRYLTVGYDDGQAETTEGAYRIPFACTLKSLRIRARVAGTGAATLTYTLMVNGSPSTLTVVMSNTSQDGSDLANSVVVAAGDLISIRVTKSVGLTSSPGDIVASMEVAA